ncbi:ATP-binding cassette domain-containing protein [Cutibacterium acnes]|jgi:ABC-type lipoprotein export system ATPase subunit|uniref:ABC transporter ATP-binding protein n=1 Tax=Cutibacterium TaxID=1912216 RepID=UPI0001EF27A6|nr:ATP-binding cassette domain-containing protein [Cutibacterium acnes]GAE73553.1 ABC transporter [Cutibacterium acnes JCM 18916]EFS58982.1 ABC transporter, ATP-binding protein [Cutibacterium acnes HL036PA1]EFS89845.1 ABC transporter, ATP-binding protein [Cutibacterium acnes HL036PA3]PIS96875.1 ABC transporter ATP-binding protein [Cutibacterium acnes]PIS97414.1 ABC transporter ATP-binding protein [Cutibacterium acnes]
MTVSWQGVTKTFPSGDSARGGCTIHCADATVDAGQACLIKGASGQGKSTMMAMIGGLLPVTSGHITIAHGHGDRDPEQARREGLVAYAFQYPFLTPYFAVWENVALCAEAEIAYQLLASCGMADLANQQASTLSGGQQQRVAVVRAVASRPAVLLADEPTASLDDDNRWAVEKLLQDYLDDGGTIIMASHQPIDLPHLSVTVEATR